MTNRINDKDVYAMKDRVNKELESNGSNGRVRVTFSYGKVHVHSSDKDHNDRHCHIDTIRGFLTRREAYDMLYAMYRMVAIINDK